jgi:hypothetical protein
MVRSVVKWTIKLLPLGPECGCRSDRHLSREGHHQSAFDGGKSITADLARLHSEKPAELLA